jgi:hypothetical protein
MIIEIWHWQAKAIAKFLLAAERKADFINIKVESEGIVLEAITENGKATTMRVFGNERPIVMCVDEWGLMGELE